MQDKWNFDVDEKTNNIYTNLCNQIDKTFKHTRQGSIKTRYRYQDGMEHFAKFLAEAYRKQNLNKIQGKYLQAYVEQMQELGYSKSYVTTNLSAIRFFVDLTGADSSKLPDNRELEVTPRTKEDRIGNDKAWKVEEVGRFIKYGHLYPYYKYTNKLKYVEVAHKVPITVKSKNLFNAGTIGGQIVFSGVTMYGSMGIDELLKSVGGAVRVIDSQKMMEL